VTSNLYAPPQARVADVAQGEAAPALWNPSAAARWSLLISPIFGAFLHMKNWEALEEPAKAAAARNWIVIYTLTIVGLAVAGAFVPHNKAIGAILRIAGLALLLGWYYASGKPQIDFVKSRYGTDYPRKGWVVPILIAVGTIIGAAFLIGVAVALTVLFKHS
jgi:hypothetical protein